MATSSERQNVRKQHGIFGTSLFCAIVLALLMVPTDASAQNGVAVIGSSTTSTPYACTPAGIRLAIGDAVNAVNPPHSQTNNITQSVVDASNCTVMTINDGEIYIGTSGSTAPNQRIKFILPANGTWTATFNNNAKYALKWGNGAMIYGGTGSGEGQPFTITAGSGANLASVCGNDPSAIYFHAEGFGCSALSGATVTDAILHINGGNDESYTGHVNASNWGATAGGTAALRTLWVHAACCSATVEDVNADAGTTANAVPCAFGDLNQAVHISKISCVHPGSTQNAVQIYQSAGTGNHGVGSSYRDIYMEQGTSASDTSTPYVEVKHLSGTFAAADLLDGFRAGIDVSGSIRCMIDIASDSGSGAPGGRVNISNLSLGDASTATCAIKDHVNGTTINGSANSVIASYDMTPRYNLGLVAGALTVGTLPTASAANAGTVFMVTDSSTSSEGGTCTGGGTTTALAFSNGSVWKCFF